MKHWLMKTEPSSYSIEDLKRDKKTPWAGVRNFQARNYMKDEMRMGDLVLIYHSSTQIPGVAGVGRVVSKSYPDPTQFEKKSEYYDSRATKAKPMWFLVDIGFVKKIKRLVSLEEIKQDKNLKKMITLRPGSRLSITPVTKKEFETIVLLGV